MEVQETDTRIGWWKQGNIGEIKIHMGDKAESPQ